MKATTTLSLVLIAGLSGWALWEHSRNLQKDLKIAALNETVSALEKAARLKVSLAAGTEVDPKGPRGLGDLVPPDAPPDSSPDKSKDKAPDASPGGVMAEMMKNPAARDALKAQTRAQLENEYRDLFDSLGLDEATADAVMKLITDRAFAQMDSAFAMSSGSPEEKAAAAAALKAESDKAEAALKEKLGPNYASFEKFEKSAPERQQTTPTPPISPPIPSTRKPSTATPRKTPKCRNPSNPRSANSSPRNSSTPSAPLRNSSRK